MSSSFVRVVVVGAGVSGLSCARLLLRAGHDVTVVSGDPLHRTTSYLAAAVWFPTAAGPAEAVARWGATTYDMLVAEAEADVPGVVMRETLMLYREAPDRSPLCPPGRLRSARSARRTEMNCLPAMHMGFGSLCRWWRCRSTFPYLHEQVLAAGATQVCVASHGWRTCSTSPRTSS